MIMVAVAAVAANVSCLRLALHASKQRKEISSGACRIKFPDWVYHSEQPADAQYEGADWLKNPRLPMPYH
jgi:hypothetical protein